jgi:hypothetical protein
MSSPKKPMRLDSAGFQAVGDACGTDKIRYHGYQRFYPQFLVPLRRLRRLGIVEIGFGEGQSISLWQTLFPQAHVYCLDRDVSQSGQGFDVLQVDQSDPAAVADVVQRIAHPVHLIVDDGSHYPPHQLSSFSLLFETLLQEGGIYILEDIETSYWLGGEIYGYPTRFGLFSRWSTVEVLKLAVDYLNRTFLSDQDRSLVEYSMSIAGLSPAAAGMVSMLSFGQNCVIASKMKQDDLSFVERPYIYENYTSRT